MITNEAILITQIVSLLAYIGIAFWLYRVLVAQKDATIESLKSNIAFLKDQLEAAKAQAPDVLLQAFRDRVGMLHDELGRLKEDHSATKEQVAAKEAALTIAKGQLQEWETGADELISKIKSQAREIELRIQALDRIKIPAASTQPPARP